MLKTINPAGGETWVHEDRLKEYLARGHVLAPPPAPPKPPAPKKRPTTKKKTEA